mmetsp:Transcript_6198/g.15423  ORF Transcript_6198/g.15423 Transcript_6198/m.15423 type:complete len:222 (-) Transcript_6198:12-677(-)
MFRFAIACAALVLASSFVSPSASGEEISTSEELRTILTNLSNRIIKEGGYVHPSLQLASPAPCGADRGVILADDDANGGGGSASSDIDDDENDERKSLWLRVPFAYQLTRDLALETLAPLIPDDVLEHAPLDTLDDAALLVLLLVHLRGRCSSPRKCKWHPFLASLSDEPGCGWWRGSDDDDADAITRRRAYRHVISDNVIVDSREYVGRVSNGMAGGYGP